MYRKMNDLLRLANNRGTPLWVPVVKNECRLSSMTEEEVFIKMERRYEIMRQSATRALSKGLATAGGLIEGMAEQHQAYSAKKNNLSGEFVNRVMARALSASEVNASMGKICAAPTAGACGVLPAVLMSVEERLGLSRRTVLEGLITASGVGAVIMLNATVSGAEGGCQAECGAAAAMAAAAAVQMAGGSNQAAVNAVSIALMNCMGLICDPVAGLVQIPCAQRNASQAVNAVISAELALGGMTCVIPADEAIEAMYRVGKMLPNQLKETAQGGVAVTPSGKAVYNKVFG